MTHHRLALEEAEVADRPLDANGLASALFERYQETWDRRAATCVRPFACGDASWPDSANVTPVRAAPGEPRPGDGSLRGRRAPALDVPQGETGRIAAAAGPAS